MRRVRSSTNGDAQYIILSGPSFSTVMHYLRTLALIVAPFLALSAQSRPPVTIDGRLLHPGVDTFYMAVTARGHVDTTGRIVRSLVHRTVAGRSVWLQVYSFDGRNDFSTIDSLMMDSRTLLPITEARYNNMGNTHVVYTSTQIRTLVKLNAGVLNATPASQHQCIRHPSRMHSHVPYRPQQLVEPGFRCSIPFRPHSGSYPANSRRSAQIQ
jgi:hypothetical protein